MVKICLVCHGTTSIKTCFCGKRTHLDILILKIVRALWDTAIDYVTVYADERLAFQFKNGV